MTYYFYKSSLGEDFIMLKHLDGSITCIPPDPANTDYQQYLEWVSQGNTPLPPDPIPEPEPLTPQQKLEAAGLSIEELKELLGL